MKHLSEEFDRTLCDFAWSVWTELGVAGVTRQHQNFLILPEELILLTAVLGGSDPRLHNEALDWCIQNHQFISVSRLKTLANEFSVLVGESLAIFCSTLNANSRAKWPVMMKKEPLKFKVSKKSRLPKFEMPALLCLRSRAFFGTTARADVMTFFLTHENRTFSAADMQEIGYTKRNISSVLESFVQTGLVELSLLRNQKRFTLSKRNEMTQLLGPIPDTSCSWNLLLKVVLTFRALIRQSETKADSSKVVELRNVLVSLEGAFQQLGLKAPPLQSDFTAYWKTFSEWILKLLNQVTK